MKKMKRFLVALLSCLTAVACVAGISACKDDNKKTDANNSSSEANSGVNITINDGRGDCKHNFKLGEASEATCVMPSYAISACEYCGKNTDESGELLVIPVAPALGHKIVKVEEVDATCTEDGINEHFACETCGKVSQDGNSWVEAVIADFVVAEATGHSFTKDVAVKPATCTEAGYTAHKACYTCYLKVRAEEEYIVKAAQGVEEAVIEAEIIASGKVALKDKTIVPAYHASYESFIENYIEATDAAFEDLDALVEEVEEAKKVKASGICGVNGFEDFQVCAICTEAKVDAILAAWEEAEKTTYDANEVLAALKAEGVEIKETVKEIAPKFAAHDLETRLGVAATCTTAGKYAVSKCKNEGCAYITGGTTLDNATVIPALGHKYVNADDEIVVFDEDDEEKDGTDVFTCAADLKCIVCAAALIEVADDDHTWVEAADKAATCTEYGWEDKTYCSVCGKEEMTVLRPVAHTWTALDVTNYTADDRGCVNQNQGVLAEKDQDRYFECTCGAFGVNKAWKSTLDEGEDQVIGAIEEIAASKIAWTTKPFTCTVDDPDTEEVEKYIAANCNDNAQNYKCVYCGENIKCEDDEVEANENNHTYTGYYVENEGEEDETKTKAKKPTCTEVGICAVCGEVDALAHKDADGETTFVELKAAVAPTCTEAGQLATYYCTLCNDLAIKEGTEFVTEIEVEGENIDLGTKSKPNADFIKQDKLGHAYTTVVPAQNATCEAIGWFKYTKCAYCGEKNAKEYMEIAKTTCAGSNAAYCHYICDKAHPDYDVTDSFVDANENGIWDKGEVVNVWAGCGKVLTNTSADALHNYNADDVCILCGKKKAA